jgi:hypothetical protein
MIIPHHPEQVRRLADICFIIFNGDVFARNRKRSVVDARICFTMLINEQGLGPSEVGRILGRDHSTIIHYLNRGEALFETDKNFRKNMVMAREDYSGKDPVYYYSSPELRKKYMEIRSELEHVKGELLDIKDQMRYDKRLQPILDVVRMRTKRGSEDDALTRIKRVYNGL